MRTYDVQKPDVDRSAQIETQNHILEPGWVQVNFAQLAGTSRFRCAGEGDYPGWQPPRRPAT